MGKRWVVIGGKDESIEYFATLKDAQAKAYALIEEARKEIPDREGRWPSWVDDIQILQVLVETKMIYPGEYVLDQLSLLTQ